MPKTTSNKDKRAMKLPKLYAPVNISFWSLRNSIGANGGVIFDNDEKVTRKCRRVITKDGWKWQIIDFDILAEYDYFVYTDKEILDEHQSELEAEYK